MNSSFVNKNDNNKTREYLYSQPHLAKFIPIATYMIKTFAKGEFKNHPNNLWYIRTEFAMCCTLEVKEFPRDLKIQFMAIDLECNPLETFNDPNLPDFQ